MISLLLAFGVFPESTDSILAHLDPQDISIETSGAAGLYRDGKCHLSYGNETLDSNEWGEWISRTPEDKNDASLNPWIQYSIKGKSMRIKKYSVRNGCCRSKCVCFDDSDIVEYNCCCKLYSYSLQGSNNNKTWTVIHKVENDDSFYFCFAKTFDLPYETIPYTFLRFVLNEEWPGCTKCMQLNQVEFFGTITESSYTPYSEKDDDDDESISIIGRIRANKEIDQ